MKFDREFWLLKQVTYKALREKPRNTAGENGMSAPPHPKNKDLRETKRRSHND